MEGVDRSAVDAMHGIAARSFAGFGEATRAVLEMLESELAGSAIFVAHLDEQDNAMRIIDASGEGSFGLAAGVEVPLDSSFCVRMAANRAPRLCNDALADPVYSQAGAQAALDIKSYVGVPLEIDEGQRVGSLCAVSHDRNQFSDRELKLLTVMARLLVNELERDIKQRDLERAGERLRSLALTDPLTGVQNRRGFDAELKRHWSQCRDTSASGVALVVLDIDRLKSINDVHGHSVGDRVLKGVARALAAEVRSDDAVGRLGGDEFGVLLVASETERASDRYLERIRDRLGTLSAELPEPVHASFGCCYLDTAESPEAALAAADQAMYVDKRDRLQARVVA